MPSIPAFYTSESNLAPLRSLAGSSGDYRALVCVFLFGGADAHNMVVPLAGNPNRAPYDAVRGANGIAVGSALALPGGQWGLHPNLPKLKAVADAGGLAALLNVGNLKVPTDRASWAGRRVPVPDELFSHNSQQDQWQAAAGLEQLPLSGWMGRAAEFAGAYYNVSPLSDLGPCFSVAGRVKQLQGWESDGLALNTSGAQAFGDGGPRGVANYTATVQAARLRQEWDNILQRTLAARVRSAIDTQAAISTNLAAMPAPAAARFSGITTSLASQLQIVLRLMHSRAAMGHRRDLFFVSLGGFDNHESLNSQFNTLMTTLDNALGAFWDAAGDLGVRNNVTLFTESEFGRTLTINSTGGSDHGWGGHHLIMGGSVNGGVYGTVDLTVNGPMDSGQGRLVPTTSLEQYYGELLRWWGIPSTQLAVVLENSGSFAAPPTMLREPTPSTPVPTLSINLMSGYQTGVLDPRLVHVRAGPATQFDRSGHLVGAPSNLLYNTAFIGASVETGALPTGWRWSVTSGMQMRTVGLGTLPTGEKYIDIRLSGTNTSGSTGFPHLVIGSANSTQAAPSVPGTRYVFACKAAIVGGSTSGLQGDWPRLYQQSFIANGNYDGDNSPINGISSYRLTTEFRTLKFVAASRAAPAVFTNFMWAFAVTAGGTVDITIRIAEPRASWATSWSAEAEEVPPYLETGLFKNEGPRFDYDPVTLRPRGVLLERQASNQLPNSVMDGAVVGTPGTYPTGYGTPFASGGVTGLNYSIVRRGVERGMRFIDIRCFGTPSGNASVVWDFLTAAQSVAYAPASAGQNWSASFYVALVNGSVPNLNCRLFAYDAAQQFISSNPGFDVAPLLKIGQPVTHVRAQHTWTMPANTASAACGVRVDVTGGVPTDFTIRIACPQMEQGSTASSFVPTWGTLTVTRPHEVIMAAGTTFSSVVNQNEGTLGLRFVWGARHNGVNFDHGLMNIYNSSTGQADRHRIYIWSPNQYVAGQTTTAGTGQGVNSTPDNMVAPGRFGAAAYAYKTNDAQGAYRGTVGGVDSTNTLPTGINSLVLGTLNNTTPQGDQSAWFQQIDYWNTRLSAADLAAITAT